MPTKHKSAEAELSDLISGVYDAALDAAQWPHVLQRTISYLDGVAGVLHFHDLTEQRCGFNCTVGDDPHFTALYLAEYAWMNPLMAKIDGLAVGTSFAATRLLPHGALSRTPFFKEWAEPQGYYDSIGAVLGRDAGSTSALYVSRHRRQGAGDDETLRRMQLLAPHFRRALGIGASLAYRQTEAALFTDIVDELHSAVMLVDATGKLLRANRSADALLTRGDAFCAAHGRLTCLDVFIDRALQDAIGAAGRDALSERHPPALVLNTARGERYLLHVLPFNVGAPRDPGDLTSSAGAAIFVHKAALQLSAAAQLAARSYALSPAESRVLQHLIGGASIPAVARALGVAPATVKTHVAHIFEKTNTRRQVDLVTLVAGFVAPHGPQG